VFAGFIPASGVSERSLAVQLQAALHQVAQPLDDVTEDQLWSRLQERLNGASIESAIAAGGDSRLASAPVFARTFGTQRFRFKRTLVGIDVFNAGGEFGFPGDSGNTALELFTIDGTDSDEFVDLSVRLFEAVDARFLFGAISFFAERYIRLRLSGRVERVDEMLWPLTSVARETRTAGVHRQISTSKGNVIQVFPDLWTGQDNMYQAAATDLGLRCFWSPDLFRAGGS
jgi:hypothetical protein